MARFRLLLSTLAFINVFAHAQVILDSSKSPLLFLGDTQRTPKWEIITEINEGVSRKMLDFAASENPSAIIHLGDMVFWGASEQSWKNADSDMQTVRNNKLPIYPVIGNHDYFGQNSPAKKFITQRFPFLKDSTWYSLRYKDIGIVLLNSQFDDLSSAEQKRQLAWLKYQMQEFQNDPAIRYIITACHKPPFSNSKAVGDNQNVQKYFVSEFNKYDKARVFISGHAHTYEHFKSGNRHFIVTGGGGGPRQRLKTTPADSMHVDSFGGGPLRDFNYCRIESDGKLLTITMRAWNREQNKTYTGEQFIIEK